MIIAKSFQSNYAQGNNSSWNLTEILSPFKEKIYKKGEQVLVQGQGENDLYFVVKGKVLLYEHFGLLDKEVIHGVFMNGEFINPEILTGELDSSRYAIAKSDTLVKAIPIVSILNLMTKSPFLSRHILHSVVGRQKGLQNRLKRLELMSTRQRILCFLVEYIEKAGKDVGFEKVIRHILTHQELAGLCNASRQSVTTVLNELRQLRIIHFNRRYLLVRDFGKLQEMAQMAHEV